MFQHCSFGSHVHADSNTKEGGGTEFVFKKLRSGPLVYHPKDTLQLIMNPIVQLLKALTVDASIDIQLIKKKF